MKRMLLQPGDRLPDLTLPRLSGEPVRWRGPSRNASVIVFIHDLGCTVCRGYLRALSERADELVQWYGRLLAVTPRHGGEGTRDAPAIRFPLLVDVGDEARQRCGVPEGAATVLIADRYGQAYVAHAVGAEHEFPPPEDTESWLRYLATQCPECGVPDEPGYGEWAW